MARAAVTCDIRGCREIVIDGSSGMLVPVHDPEALAESVMNLLRDESLRTRIGAAGRQRIVAGYTESSVAQRVMDIYTALVR